MYILMLVLHYAGSGVNSVQVVLSGLSMKLLSTVHVCDCCRCGGCGMSDVYMLECW